MTNSCPCIGHHIKELISKSYPNLDDILNVIADCTDDDVIEFACKTSGKGSGKGSGSGIGKRAPSAYNLHISSCMKGKVKGFGQASAVMKECAIQWKKLKGKG